MSEETQTKVEDFEDDDDEAFEGFISYIVGGVRKVLDAVFFVVCLVMFIYCLKQLYDHIPVVLQWLSSQF